MNITAVFALMEAGSLDLNTATKIVAKLEAQGMTIYKKKIFKNGKRPTSSQPMTPAIAKAIRAYYSAYPDATQQEIANKFNVNIGRVNEVLV
jgi:DNA-binding MarR family transcriptional regulator